MLSSASFEGILVHVDGVVIDVNQRLSEMPGYELSELLGPTRFSAASRPRTCPTSAAIASAYEGAYVITGVRKDGRAFRAELQSKQGTSAIGRCASSRCAT